MMNLFLHELGKTRQGERILLVLDQAGWHKSKGLEVPDNIELMYLPPYSPELNPVERLWRYLKHEAVHNILHNTLDKLMDALESALRATSKEQLKTLCACSYISAI